MDLANMNPIVLAAGGISAIAGAYYSILKVLREIRKSKEVDAKAILEQAKENDNIIRAKLEAKIDILELDLKNLQANINKDIEHVKEFQATEIKNLANKVDMLREELNNGHSNLVQLLTKLITKS